MKLPIIAFATATALALTFSACEKKGPAEELGEKIDGAVEDLQEAVDNDGSAEKVGEKIDKLIENKE